jgi:predicted nuclease with RNAse H fold
VRALGVDVGVRKGLDLVLLDESLQPAATLKRVRVEQVGDVLDELTPDVVAIDSPPDWALSGKSRLTEREIRYWGIQCFGTPTKDRGIDHDFYEWMRTGFKVFAAAEERGFLRYRGPGSVKGAAIEVFPHASAVVLAGCLPGPKVRPREWRAQVLEARGVPTETLRSLDQVDAALAALTGMYALRNRFSSPGDPKEGQIVLPAAAMPAGAYHRCHQEASIPVQPSLPGMSPCACGDPECTALTSREFAPGHDAKRKSRLWARARLGQEAVEELKRRKWEVPPEMR